MKRLRCCFGGLAVSRADGGDFNPRQHSPGRPVHLQAPVGADDADAQRTARFAHRSFSHLPRIDLYIRTMFNFLSTISIFRL